MNLDRSMERGAGGAERRPGETGGRRRFLASVAAALGLLAVGPRRRPVPAGEGKLSLREAEFYRPEGPRP
jgi:hypothetical protein